MASTWLLLLFNVCFLLTFFIDLTLSKADRLIRSNNDKPNLQLSVFPSGGTSTENIELRCQITQPSTVSSLTSSKFDNVYLSVKTDNVKPSGILLMFDDSSDGCRINRENVHIEFCNASLIIIHINHIILNETLQKIDYSCSKGNIYATSSYRIIKDQTARYYDPTYNSTSCLTHSLVLLLFVLVITRIEIRWS